MKNAPDGSDPAPDQREKFGSLGSGLATLLCLGYLITAALDVEAKPAQAVRHHRHDDQA